MQRVLKRLTAREVAQCQAGADRWAVMVPDGGNLYLAVSRDRTHPDRIHRSWVFRLNYMAGVMIWASAQRIRWISRTRETKAKALRQQLLDGTNPLAARQQINRDQLAKLAAERSVR